jgi:hypothetical protein
LGNIWEHDGNKSIKKFHPQLTRRQIENVMGTKA